MLPADVLLGVQCLTEDGSELTRLSVVDLAGKRIYDKLVKPDHPILDYLTRCVTSLFSILPAKADPLCIVRSFSGMTEEKLEGVTTRLEDVQRDLTQLLDYNTILVGHSLECDLKVLKVRYHASVRRGAAQVLTIPIRQCAARTAHSLACDRHLGHLPAPARPAFQGLAQVARAKVAQEGDPEPRRKRGRGPGGWARLGGGREDRGRAGQA